MKIGIAIQNFGKFSSKHNLRQIAKEVERKELDSIWTSDHIMVKKNQHPWTRVFDSVTTLSFFAGMTENVQLGTSILLAALRNPIESGKQIATLDSLCEGRLIIGIGIGWNKAEFDMLNVDFESRAQKTEEIVKQWRSLWSGNFHKDYSYEPLPVQKNGPPILIGGQSKAALKRVANYGDGWHPVGIDEQKYEKGIQDIQKLRKSTYYWTLRIALAAEKDVSAVYTGTDGSSRIRLVGSQKEIVEKIEKYHEIGLSHLVCDIRENSQEDYKKQVGMLSEIKSSFS